MTTVDWKTPWAFETNYASGAYAGTATKIAPVGDVMVPDTKPPAQNFNYTLNDVESRLTRYIVSLGVGNWPAAQTVVVVPGPTNATLHTACWNFNLQRWTAMAFVGGGLWSMDTHDGGQTWNSLNASSVASAGGAIASTSNGSLDLFCNLNTSSSTAIVTVTFNGVQTETTQPFLGFLHAATMFNLPGFGSFIVGSVQTGGTMTGHMGGSSTGTGVWSDLTTTLPASWQSATNHAAMYLSANDGTFTTLGNNYLAGLCGASTTDTSRIVNFGGAGGITSATDITPAFLSGKVLSGLAYSNVDQLWGVVCWDATFVYLYTSPDLSTWTLVHTFGASAGGATPGGSLAVVGGVWCLQLTVLDGGSGTTDNDRLMISGDVGPLGASAQWTTANYDLIDDTTGGLYPTPQLVSNGHQLLAWNNGAYFFSRQVGFTPSGAY